MFWSLDSSKGALSKLQHYPTLAGTVESIPADGEEDEAIVFSGDPPIHAPKELQVLDSSSLPQCRLGLIRGFMSPVEVASIHEIMKAPGIKEIRDRQIQLEYAHNAYRMERQVKAARPKIYTRLMNTSWAIDTLLWHKIGDGFKLYPELEYIDYDVTKLRRQGKIEPHTDNESVVSVIVLLSDQKDFVGGVNYFEDGTDNGRKVELKAGDAIFFNGEECEHWITPVTSGRRCVLQLELSTGHWTWSGLMLAWFCSMVTLICAALHIYAIYIHEVFWIGIPIMLGISLHLFGSRKRLPIAVRCCPQKQFAILVAMLVGFAALASIPGVMDRHYANLDL